MMFKDRAEAGLRLSSLLIGYANDPQALVVALPRGGVVVGYEVAHALHLPLDIVCPRKIASPDNPEYALGAVTESGETFFETPIDTALLAPLIAAEQHEALSRLHRYRHGLPPRQLANKKIILVDDGLATGATMQAALKTVQAAAAKEVIIAIPVAPPDTLKKLTPLVSKIICLHSPPDFYAIGQFYEHFEPTSDDTVIQLINKSLVYL